MNTLLVVISVLSVSIAIALGVRSHRFSKKCNFLTEKLGRVARYAQAELSAIEKYETAEKKVNVAIMTLKQIIENVKKALPTE